MPLSAPLDPPLWKNAFAGTPDFVFTVMTPGTIRRLLV